ncbi:MAG: hypothetical protein BMS9Abin07_0059 [Acidimicrobiia bacterium]|nr:MAG: hypothetical protein BMS9Abin07_0059 [Acidimicrobiia bacterium]
MTPHLASIGASVFAGLVPGWLLAGTPGAVVGGTIGAGIGFAGDQFEIRTVVAASVTAGTVAGAFIGRGVVSVICLPATCVAFEIVGAILTGAGAFIGVGIIVALATRSFDEYRERQGS